MFSGFLVIFFIKFPNQLLKNSTHAVVIKTRVLEDRLRVVLVNRIRTQVNVRGCKLFNDCTENIRIHHRINLISEFELIQNHLHIGRKAVKVCYKVSFECLRLGATGQILQQEGRCIAESLSSCIA